MNINWEATNEAFLAGEIKLSESEFDHYFHLDSQAGTLERDHILKGGLRHQPILPPFETLMKVNDFASDKPPKKTLPRDCRSSSQTLYK